MQGYQKCNAYIATQGPLPSTVNDVWQMVWEYESKYIVMLCNLQEVGVVGNEIQDRLLYTVNFSVVNMFHRELRKDTSQILK